METLLKKQPDSMDWHCDWLVSKYDEDMTAYVQRALRDIFGPNFEPLKEHFDQFKITPYEVQETDGNLLTTVGLSRITSLIFGAGGTAVGSTTARIGVGDGAGTAAIGDTDLSASAGSTHRQFVIMDATFPTRSNGVMTFQATFTTSLGNFAWNEFGIDVDTATVANGTTVGALLLNHKTSIAQGTKVSGQSWAASAVVTLS